MPSHDSVTAVNQKRDDKPECYYRPDNRIGKTLKGALANAPKLLLTATPLQNSLMELYGLVSLIDDFAFGDAKSFRAQYVARVAQGPCGQQQNGPYSIHSDGTYREETQLIVGALQLGSTCGTDQGGFISEIKAPALCFCGLRLHGSHH